MVALGDRNRFGRFSPRACEVRGEYRPSCAAAHCVPDEIGNRKYLRSISDLYQFSVEQFVQKQLRHRARRRGHLIAIRLRLVISIRLLCESLLQRCQCGLGAFVFLILGGQFRLQQRDRALLLQQPAQTHTDTTHTDATRASERGAEGETRCEQREERTITGRGDPPQILAQCTWLPVRTALHAQSVSDVLTCL